MSVISVQDGQVPAVDAPRELLARLRRTFSSGKTRSYAWRHAQLTALLRLIEASEGDICRALEKDLGKAPMEVWVGEMGLLESEVRHARRHLGKWMRPTRVSSPLVLQPSWARIRPEPLGVALIIGPWNYPIQLVLGPLIGAIAAGNCAVVKPSELTPHASRLVAHLVDTFLDGEAIAVVEGGGEVVSGLLAERFDHIFFTGSGRIGRVVMEAAAKHLTPVTLELGGKSPCIVDARADIDISARRIAWGKFFNAGQTCVAPDYVLVHETCEQPLLQALKNAIQRFYGADPRQSRDYPRIVNARHHERLSALLGGGEVVCGGDVDAADRYIAPTVLRNVSLAHPLMQEEIFGPLLPVLTVSNIDEAIAFVNARTKPLALYVFSEDASAVERVLRDTSSGAVNVNDTITQMGVVDLPFGGVGASGMGAYHGKASFDTFSHEKCVLHRPTWVDPPLRYAPYTPGKLRWLRRLF